VAVDVDVRKAVALAKNEAREARRERDEARRERDEAIGARHDCSLEMQILKQEATEYKAAVSFLSPPHSSADDDADHS
jgi:regulator of protease activity HflC (stomatin/prohibitin superfamily)